MPQIILHLDMNSYFASVEQQANPFYRGKSVGVCAYLSPGGCIIASSREAKAKGIKTGCRVSDAKKLDPGVILVENEPAKYRAVTEKIFKIMGEYSNALEPYSIDEAFLDLTGYVKNFTEANNLAEIIRKRIKTEVGTWLDCSIGISWTRFLAKFAGDLAPKKGTLIIHNRNKLAEVLLNRPLTEAWGIGAGWERRLNDLNITTLDQLANFDQDHIRRIFGRPGYYLWANLNGIEIDAIHDEPRLAKSIGHSYCLPKKTKDKEYLSKIFFKLCEKTGHRLRANGQEAKHINIFCAYGHFGGVGFNRKLSDNLFTTTEIFAQVEKFLKTNDMKLPVSMVAVSVSCLAPLSGQLSFFDNRLKKKDLSQAMDKINDRYGEYTVALGAMWGTGDMARDRIGFRKIA